MSIHLTAYRNKTVLVTGAAGAIGSNLCKRLAHAGALVLAVDDLSSSEGWNIPQDPKVVFQIGDILDESLMLRVFEQRPAIVFHLAACFANQNSIDYPERDLLVNGMGTLRLLALSLRFRVSRFVYTSTSSIYKAIESAVIDKSSPIYFGSPYQMSKMLGEEYCTFFSQYYGLSVVKTRLFNSYGPGDLPGKYRGVIPNFIYLAMKGRSLPITGSGNETRDFTYVEDIVDGLMRLALSDAVMEMVVNLSSGIETRIGDLAESINHQTGNQAGVHFRPQRKWDDHTRRCGSFKLAKEIVGYEPRTFLRDGLERSVDWFRSNWERIESGTRLQERLHVCTADESIKHHQ
jgi:UDP-glucose 4-epimerase